MGPGRLRRARPGRERGPPLLSQGSLPRALLRSGSLRGFGASLSVVHSCSSSSLSPRSGMSSPETSGDPPSLCHADGHPEVRGGTAQTALWAPQRQLLPPRHRPWSRGPPSRPGPCAGCPAPLLAAALCPSPVPSPRARAQSRGSWPAEGPVGPEMCHGQGGERPLGEEPCRCILFSKKIKYFHGKLSLCVFLSPLSPSVPFSWVVFQGQLRVSFPWRPHPAGSPGSGCGPGPAWGLGCAEARAPRAICAAWPRPRAQREGQRMAVWPQVLGESASCAFPLALLTRLQTHPGLVCSASLPAAGPQGGGGGPGSWLPTPRPYPRQHLWGRR